MSIEVLEDICVSLQSELEEYINDQPLDMLEEFTAEEIASEVVMIARHLLHVPSSCGHIIHKKSEDIPKYSDYMYSINNEYKGFVSMSDDYSTGVERTEYYCFWHDGDECLDGLKNLASMINAAWYNCKN